MFTIYELDKARNIKFNMKALALIEKKLNIKIGQIEQNGIGINEIAVILWAGLQHEDASLSIEKVMDLVDEHSSLDEAAEKIGKAFDESFGKKK
jgi:hypothetical protein